ncbi:MAG: sialidase family protein [Acidimicrobiales bacterium]
MRASHRYGRIILLFVVATVAAPIGVPHEAGAQAVGQVRATSENYRLGTSSRAVRGGDVPGLAVDPADPRHIVEVHVDLADQLCEFNVTFDGAGTWTGGTLTAPAGFTPPCRSPAGSAYPAMDQSVAFGSGQAVYTTFSSIRAPEGDSVLIAKSTDGGRTFGPPSVILPGGPSSTTPGNPLFVRPKLAVHAGAGPGGADIVYVTAWLLGPAERQAAFIRSEDGGATWSAPGRANLVGESAREQTQPVVGPDGAVYVAFRIAAFRSVGPIVVARSDDRGQTWTQTRVRDIGHDPNLELAVDHRNSTVYLAYNETRPGPDIDVMLQRSTDRGATWSAPLRVNDDPVGSGAIQHLPDLSVAPDGRLDVVWHDRRNAYKGVSFPACPYSQRGPFLCEGDVYYAYSLDGGLSFSQNRRITDRIINLDVGFDRRLETYTSHTPVSVPLGTDGVLFAWADSREGNYDNDTQDIYLARLDLRAGGAIPVRRLTEERGPGYAVALSKRAFPGGLETVANLAATKAVVVNDRDAASALAGAVLARANYGGVFPVPGFGVPRPVQGELARVQSTETFLVGDEGGLSSRVVDDVKAVTAPLERVTRLSGPDPATTGLLVARALDTRLAAERAAGTAPFAGAVVVNPAGGEGASAAALAASLRLPVLFVQRDAIPAATAQALAELAIPATLVIGGPDVVSDAVAAQLPAPKRLAGPGVAGTSVAVAAEAVARGVPANVVYVGDSERPVEAAVLGAAVARLGGLMLLTPGADPAAAEQAIDRLGLRSTVDSIVVARPATPPRAGYRLVAGDGGVFSFGGAAFLGSTGGIRLSRPMVGASETPSGDGYWLTAADGGVFAFGDARFRGSTGALRLAQPVVAMAATPTGNGYWLVARDGGVFAFGDARFLGSAAQLKLNSPIVGMASTPTGKGYWLVGADGGVFAFGDAVFRGSTGALALTKPIVGMARSATGLGYRLVASDGGVFAFGDARFHGSTGSLTLNRPVVSISGTPTGDGYWLAASDGGVFAFGDAVFVGSTGGLRLAQPVVGMATG